MGTRIIRVRSKDRRCRWLSSTAALVIIMASSAASAQDPGVEAPQDTQSSSPPAEKARPGESSQRSGDILVTARRRVESAQEVPAVISAVSGEHAEKANVTDMLALPRLFSGLDFTRVPDNSGAITLRGLGTTSGSFTFEQAISLFVDGVYAGRPHDLQSALFDLERIEVIRGTQTGLLGKNTSLGAISIVTREPGSDVSYNLSGLYDFSLGSTRFDGGMDVPLADDLSFRIAARREKQDGWVHNVIRDNDAPSTLFIPVRATLVWQPNADLKAKLVFQHDYYKSWGNPGILATDPTGTARQFDQLGGLQNPFVGIGGYNNAATDPVNGDQRYKQNSNKLIANIDYTLGNYTLSSVTGYTDYKADFVQDSDGRAGSWLTQFRTEDHRQFYQDIRLNSPSDEFLEFTIGASYLDARFQFQQRTVVLPPYPRDGAFEDGIDQRQRSASAYGQVTANLGEKIKLTGGGRYTHEKKDADIHRTTLATGGGQLIALFPPFPLTRVSRKENSWDYSVGGQYFPTSEIMFYITYAKGTKGGGFQNAPTNAATAEFGHEVARTLEGGTKVQWGNGFFDLSLFDTKVAGFQVSQFNGAFFQILSLPVRSTGADAEATWSPIDRLRLHGAVTYAYARQRDNGLRLQHNPRWSGNVSADYSLPAGPLFVDINGNVEFRSRMLLRQRPSPVPDSPGYAKFNARLALRPEDSRWEVALIGSNLFDKYSYSYGVSAPFLPPTSTIIIPDQPRTVALQITIRK